MILYYSNTIEKIPNKSTKSPPSMIALDNNPINRSIYFEKFKVVARRKANLNRASLKWETQFNKKGK